MPRFSRACDDSLLIDLQLFDFIAEKGELRLAKSQDDPSNRVGWIWSKHFIPLASDDSEDAKKQTVSSKSRLPRKTHLRNTSASCDSGFDFGFK